VCNGKVDLTTQPWPRGAAGIQPTELRCMAGSECSGAVLSSQEAGTWTPMMKRRLPSTSAMGASVNMFQKGLPLFL